MREKFIDATPIDILQCNLAKADPSPGLAKCFFPDRANCAEWVKLISPVFSSGPSVGKVFKGRHTLRTAVFQFDFRNLYLSFNTVKSPQFCVHGGCKSCG
jgi:hypothetical protein